MVSDDLGKISRLCPPRFSLSRFALFLLYPSPLWCSLPWCPGQLPQLPTPRSATDDTIRYSNMRSKADKIASLI